MNEQMNIRMNRRHFLSAAVLLGVSAPILSGLGMPDKASAAITTDKVSMSSVYGRSVTMTSAPQGKGILKTYKGGFKTTSVQNLNYFPGLDGKLKVVYSAIGLTNQFQVADAATGKVESSITPSTNSTPGTMTGVKYNSVDGNIYSTSMAYAYQYSRSLKTLKNIGHPTAKSTLQYGPAIDRLGRVWYGTYPDAHATCYDPKKGTWTSYPVGDAGTDYIRTIEIVDDIVYCGTGSVSPKIISFPISNPAALTVIQVPNISSTGFVFRLKACAGTLFAFFETESLVETCAAYNLTTKTWTTLSSPPVSRSIASIDGESWVYYVTKKNIMKWNPKTPAIAPSVIQATSIMPATLYAESKGTEKTLYMFSEFDMTLSKVSLNTGAVSAPIPLLATGSELRVQDLLASADGKIWTGGYMGDGISSIDMKTDARWSSARKSGINQIEGMIDYGSKIYVGSYGSADLFSFTKSPASYKRIVRLRTNYNQSRPFAWAIAGGMIINGTVPDYGIRGGALTKINPTTDTVVKVFNNLISDQSIVGLFGDGNIVYGTTSVKGGYGITDDTNPATVFAFDVVKDTMVWTNKSLVNETEIQAPILVQGRLFVAVVNGIIELNPKTGAAVASYKFYGRVSTPGYRNITMDYSPVSRSLVHRSGGTITSLSLDEPVKTLLFAPTVGGTMSVSPDGRIFAVTDDLNVSEIDCAYSPTITSSADIVSISPGGGISLGRSNRNGVFAVGIPVVTSGYSNAKSVHAVDTTLNGIFDLVSNHSDGTLRIAYGLRQGGFSEQVIVGKSGWDTRRITVGSWDSRTPYPGIISIDSAGSLEFWQIQSDKTVKFVKTVGRGWSSYSIAILDLKGDGNIGILAQQSAAMYFYPSDQLGGLKDYSERLTLATGGYAKCKEFAVVERHKGTYSGIVWKETSGVLKYISNVGGVLQGIITYSDSLSNYRLGGASS